MNKVKQAKALHQRFLKVDKESTELVVKLSKLVAGMTNTESALYKDWVAKIVLKKLK